MKNSPGCAGSLRKPAAAVTSRLNKEGELTPGAPAVIRLDDSCSIINKTLKPAVSEWIIYQIGARLKETFTEITPILTIRGMMNSLYS